MKFIHTLYILLLINLFVSSCKLAPIRIRQHRGDKVVAVKPLSKNINSFAEELSPVISRDGNTLFFVRAHHPDNIGGVDGGQDIWMSKRDTATREWLPAVNLGAPVNNTHHNVVCGTNRNGTVIYLTQQYNKNGSMESGISKSVWRKGKWSFPEPIEVKGIRGLSGNLYFYMDPSGRFLIMSMRPRGGRSAFQEDLYVFFWDRKRKCFRRKKRLPSIINSAAYETAPFLSSDRKRLYFTRYDQQANAHIYVAQRNDVNNWNRWSEPLEVYQALGDSELHSEHFEAYFVLHSNRGKVDDYGFFVTARPGVIQADSEKGEPYKADIYEFEIKRQYTIEVITRDKKTRKPLATNVVLKDDQGKIISPKDATKKSKHVFSKLTMAQVKRSIFNVRASTEDSHYFDAQQEGIKFGGIYLYKLRKVLYLEPNTHPYTLIVETRDAKTKKLLPTDLQLKDSKGETLKNDLGTKKLSQHNYRLQWDDIQNNAFTAEASTGSVVYIPVTEKNIRFSSKKQLTLKKTIYLKPRQKVEELPHISFAINFDFDSARIRSLEAKLLDITAKFIQKNQLLYALHGHTDAVGRKAKNDSLAKQRVVFTLNYLRTQVPDIQQKLRTSNFSGEESLLVPTPHRDERNRRVEITIFGVNNEAVKQAFLEELKKVREEEKKTDKR